MRLEAFHKKNLVKAQKIIDDSVSNQLVLQVSSLNTSMRFDSLTKLFEGKNIDRNMSLRNQLKKKWRMQKWWWPPWMASRYYVIHLVKECVLEGSDYFQQTLERAYRRRSSTHNKRRGKGRNWISSSHDSKKIPQAMRNMKNSILE